MGVGRWRWSLVLVAGVVAGCLPPSTPAMPAGFVQAVREQGWVFEPGEQGLETVPATAALTRIRRMRDPPPFVQRAPLGPPTYGDLTCVDRSRGCQTGQFPNGVWLIQFPGPGADDPIAWVVADGTGGGLWMSGGR